MNEYVLDTPPTSPKIKKLEKYHKCSVPGCTAAFYRPYRLDLHLKKHLGEKPFICNVSGCSKSYTNSSHLRRHKAIVHENQKAGDKQFLCSVEGCGLVLANKYSLQKHLNRHHTNTNFPFQCSKCPERFKKKRNLNEHFFSSHEEAPYKCESCNISFVSLILYTKHKRNHKVYTCDCEQKFDRWSKLLKHRKTDCLSKETVHTCVICNKTFTLKRNLTFHIVKKHVEESRRELYRCPYLGCTRSYQYGKNLNYHIKSVHDEINKQVKCTEPNCDQVFKQERYLERHIIKMHKTNKKPKKPRRHRKDKGKRKKCIAAYLTGVKLTPAEHLEIINREFPNTSTSLKPPEEFNVKPVDNFINTSLQLRVPDYEFSARDHVSNDCINGFISFPVVEKNEMEKEKVLVTVLKRENIDKVANKLDKPESRSYKADNCDEMLSTNPNSTAVSTTVVMSEDNTNIEQIIEDVLILPLALDPQENLNICPTNDLTGKYIANDFEVGSNSEFVIGNSLIVLDSSGNIDQTATPEPGISDMETEITESHVVNEDDGQLLDLTVLNSDTVLLRKCDEVLRNFNLQEEEC